MRVWPVFIDSQPAYLHGRGSLLQAPLGANVLIEQVAAAVRMSTSNAPLIVAPAGADAAYESSIHAFCPNGEVVWAAADLTAALAAHELSDAVLIVDPRCLPADGLALASLMRHHTAEPRLAHHLVAFDRAEAGTKERVCLDATGQVRAIQRHYEHATWPFISGVAASLLPVSCGLAAEGVGAGSLTELRRLLISRGVPSRDLPFEGDALDLTVERNLLVLNERHLRDAMAPRGDELAAGLRLVGNGHRISPDARLLGQIVVQSGATVEAGATVLGPAVIGAHAHIRRDAVVAHSVVGSRAVVSVSGVVRDRAWFGSDAEPLSQGPSPISFAERLAVRSMDGPSVVAQQQEQGSYQRHLAVKRAIDIVGAIVGLTLMSPLLLVTAVAVWLESRWPIFYGDLREGWGGRLFRCWKFRTMFSGAHMAQRELKALNQTDGPHFKVDRDPRVTRVGSVLRALNLDEIPQLYNVLVGEMSLVGPRPSPFRENQVCVPWRAGRLSVRPGITGLWQVCRHDRAAGDFHQWIEYDLLYVQHLTVWLDIKILAATLLTLGGKLGYMNAARMIGSAPLDLDAATTSDAPARSERQVA